ncbi:hypothetical protein TO73_1218 [Thermus aquaticus Y51MC23]|uniref:Uncharacterized protein n=1 Tax=Thermus aquaticus (strain ATCC BAA-2747 / Y51MC23) TaxID=498848 RepID=A0ABN4IJ81_THEA5|nr:hypothetical protein TO73_1218 [Thermus aquaticus Y51MC23]
MLFSYRFLLNSCLGETPGPLPGGLGLEVALLQPDGLAGEL